MPSYMYLNIRQHVEGKVPVDVQIQMKGHIRTLKMRDCNIYLLSQQKVESYVPRSSGHVAAERTALPCSLNGQLSNAPPIGLMPT